MSLEISPSTPQDQADCEQLLEQMYPRQEYPEFQLERVTTDARLEAETLVAREGGKAIGLAIVTFVDYGAYPYGVIEELVVDTHQREQGLGRSLVDAASQWVADRGGKVIYVDPSSGQAEDYYRSLGFEPRQHPQLLRVVEKTEIPAARRTWN